MKLQRLALYLYRVVEDNHFRYARFLVRRGWASIGDNTSVNPWAVFMDWGKVTIGRDCSISMCEFVTHNGGDRIVTIRTGQPCRTNAGITVGDRTTIGTGVKIIGPVSIGSDVVIAASSVVTCDVPDGVVVGGIPARVIGLTSDYDTRQLVRHVKERIKEGGYGLLAGGAL